MSRPAGCALALIMAAAFGIRAWRTDQPIVENYVGRQVPTAMVARNLERGSGFLEPQLDTGPFPNHFLVEPPIYQALVVGAHRLTGWELAPTGRLVSSLGIVLGLWGLFGLVERREGRTTALVAAAVFAALPVTLRYGRAFQPDALMLGAQLAALNGWDVYASGRGRLWIVAAWPLLATSLALKVTSIFIFIPLFFAIPSGSAALGRHNSRRPGWLGPRLRDPGARSLTTSAGGRRRRAFLIMALSSVVPVILWYIHALYLMEQGGGSRASLENRRIWLSALAPAGLLDAATYRPALRFLLVRCFTPLGTLLAVWGLARRPIDRLWWLWGLSALGMLAALAEKWHHEYYWLVLAPVVSVGIARSLVALAERPRDNPAASTPTRRGGRLVASGLGAFLLAISMAQSASTWRTPAEWSGLEAAGRAVDRLLPPDAWVIAPEALLWAADRRGCRLELKPSSAERAASEWGGRLANPEDPLALVDFYRARGARYLADLTTGEPTGRRRALHQAVRARDRVLIDGPVVFLAELKPPVSKGDD